MLIVICILPFVAFVALQSTGIQTIIVKKAVKSLENDIDGNINVKKISVVFFNTIILHDVSVTGKDGDTLAALNKFSVSFNPQNIILGKLKFDRVYMDDGCFNLLTVDTLKHTNIKQIFNFHTKKKSGKIKIPTIRISEIIVRNLRYTMYNPYKDTVPRNPSCANFKNLKLGGINGRFENFKLDDNKISCKIKYLNFRTHFGYSLNSLTGNFSFIPGEWRIDNLAMKDSYSVVHSKYLSFKHKQSDDYLDFMNKVVMGGDFFNTTLDFRSIGVFAQSLVDNNLRIGVKGVISGPVSALRSKNLLIEYKDSTKLRMGVSITGLPYIANTTYDFDFKDVKTCPEDVEYIVSRFAKSLPNGLIANIIPNNAIRFTGTASGKYLDFHSVCSLLTGIGDLSLDVISSENKDNGRITMQGNVSTKNLNVGKIAKQSLFGELTMNTGFTASFGGIKKGGDFKISNLNIDKFNVNGYDHKRIKADGELNDNLLNLRMTGDSEALNFIFHGIANFRNGGNRGKNGFINRFNDLEVYLNVPTADLKAMHITKTGEIASAKFIASAKLHLEEYGNIGGNVKLTNFAYNNDNGNYEIDSIDVNSKIDGRKQFITLTSPILKAEYSGRGNLPEIIGKIKKSLIADNFPSLLKSGNSEESVSVSYGDTSADCDRHYCKLNVSTLHTAPLLATHFPKLRIADGTTAALTFNENDELNLHANSVKISVGGNKFENISLDLNNDTKGIDMTLVGGKANLGGIIMENSRMKAKGKNDSIFFKYNYDNVTTPHKDSLDFSSVISFKKEDNRLMTIIDVFKSRFYFKSFDWYFKPCKITIGEKYYSFENFLLFCGNEYLKIQGMVAAGSDNAVSIDLNHFDISMLNAFSNKDLDLKGYFSGDVSISNLFDQGKILMNLKGEEISISNRKIGKILITSLWNQNNERFDIFVKNQLGNREQLNASGYYRPSNKHTEIQLSFNDLELYYLTPFLKDILTIRGGTLTGNLKILGQSDKVMITSKNCKISSLNLIPEYTKTPYIFDGNISINRNNIYFKEINISDQFGNKGKLEGNISHKFFKDVFLNAKLSFDNLQCLNTAEKDNDIFYGKAFATGNISMSGRPDDLKIDTEFKTTGNTVIHVPLSSSSSAKKSDLIFYRSMNEDSEKETNEFIVPDKREKEKKSNRKGKIEITAKAVLTPDAELQIELNKEIGDVLKCRGNGDIDVKLNPSKNLTNLRGDYTLTEGNYHLSLYYIQSRDFIIDPGGTITLTGNLKNTKLDVGATYRTKTSISTLIADTASVGNRRNIDCRIRFNGLLTNPGLSFSIDIPDLDPITKGRVESALSTPAKIQRQFMALLISGSFIPDRQSGIVNNSTILYSNAGEILSNQFNNIFRQLDIPLDLGLNYQPGSTVGGKDMFDVAISYQAFNNRLIINGNVGNSENSSNWAGNLNVEYKVDKNGKLRVTLFTRAADNYSNYLDNTQRNGFGFTFQDEFNTFGEFWRNLFYSKRRKEEYELEQIRKAKEDIRKEAEAANIVKKDIVKAKEEKIDNNLINYD